MCVCVCVCVCVVALLGPEIKTQKRNWIKQYINKNSSTNLVMSG